MVVLWSGPEKQQWWPRTQSPMRDLVLQYPPPFPPPPNKKKVALQLPSPDIFFKCTTKCGCVERVPPRLSLVYWLTEAVWEQRLAVSSCRVINHCPRVCCNGLETQRTPISCNYEPSERWTQGDYDFRFLGCIPGRRGRASCSKKTPVRFDGQP